MKCVNIVEGQTPGQEAGAAKSGVSPAREKRGETVGEKESPTLFGVTDVEKK